LLIFNTQTESSDDAFKDTELDFFNEEKEKIDTENEHNEDKHNKDEYNEDENKQDENWMIMCLIGIQDFFKCTVRNADLNERSEDMFKLKKVWYIDQSADSSCCILYLMISERLYWQYRWYWS